MTSAVRAQGTVRGTQSFVHVIARTWKRPLVLLTEIAWRWLAGAPVLFLAWNWIVSHQALFAAPIAEIEGASIYKPVAAIVTLADAVAAMLLLLVPLLVWLLPLAVLLGTLLGTLGRTFISRRLEPATRWNFGAIFSLRLLRALGLVACGGVWVLIAHLARVVALGAAMQRVEPNVVLYLSILIIGSLLLFVGWAIVNWPFALAQALAWRDGVGAKRALVQAVRSKEGPQVLEINLVMCVVKIALLVLALVASASPLPFETAATTGYLHTWWVVVVVVYLTVSDYFHAVRVASYLALMQARD